MLRVLCLLLLCAPVAAQPFETIEVGLSGVGTVADAPFTDFWDPGPGIEVWAATPFYLGDFRLGLAAAWHTASGAAADPAVPDFVSFYTSAGWSVGIGLPGGVQLAPGVRVGLFNMRFDTDDPAAVRSEAELTAGFDLRASVPIASGWRLTAGGSAVRMFTAERIDLGFVQVGVSRAFRTPEWLREALR
ncbi:MAG: hypothetical protein AAGI91_00745 [Bacteroidota bacterium]